MITQGDILAGRYQLMEKIGQGGTGIVYKAYDRNLQKYVVVKKIKDNFAGSINDRIEVDILKRLHHPYIPQVYDFVIVDRQVFTVMDFVDGYELKKYLDSNTALPEKILRKWLEQLLEVLSYLHRQTPPIIHGDIKPANIMVTQQGDICLIDFNISLGDGDLSAVLGLSEAYASPEQIQKAALARQGLPHHMILLDERSDLYSLAKSFRVLIQNGMAQGAVYTDTFQQIVCKAMEEDPAQRYQTADKMLSVIKNIEKSDDQYRSYYLKNILVHGGYAVCMVVSVLLIYFGYYLNGKETYTASYNNLQKAIQTEDGEEIVDQGIDVLNLSEYKRRAKKNPDDAAVVLHAVGDGFYLQEDYSQAAEYYRQAIEEGENTPDRYYLDYGLALVQDGQNAQARVALADARAAGVTENLLRLIDGELAYADGDMNRAMELLEETAGCGGETGAQAYIQMADIYEAEGNYNQSINCLLSAQHMYSSNISLRKLGTLYYKAGRQKDAAACYKELIQTLQPAYEDWINYAVCCESTGNYSEGMTALREAAEAYPGRYEAYMHLAFSSYKLGRKSEAREYYSQAEEAYKNAESSDSMMEELKELLK